MSLGNLIVVAAAAGRTDDQFPLENLFKLRDAALAAGHADRHLVIGAADPVEFGRLDRAGGLTDQGIEGDAAGERADGGPVLGGGLIEPARKGEASPPPSFGAEQGSDFPECAGP